MARSTDDAHPWKMVEMVLACQALNGLGYHDYPQGAKPSVGLVGVFEIIDRMFRPIQALLRDVLSPVTARSRREP